MATLSDAQIDELLQQAERRLGQGLSSCQTAAPVQSKPQTVIETTTETTSDAPAAPSRSDDLGVREVQKPKSQNKVKNDAGNNWFGMPETNLTPEFKRDWQVLRMRGMLDPKHHKKALSSKPPKYSQVGEIIAGATDSQSSKLTKREKKRTLLEEMMSTQDTDKLRGKYDGIVKKKASGKKAYYDKLVSQRRSKR